jgi:hypothetical protein
MQTCPIASLKPNRSKLDAIQKAVTETTSRKVTSSTASTADTAPPKPSKETTSTKATPKPSENSTPAEENALVAELIFVRPNPGQVLARDAPDDEIMEAYSAMSAGLLGIDPPSPPAGCIEMEMEEMSNSGKERLQRRDDEVRGFAGCGEFEWEVCVWQWR